MTDENHEEPQSGKLDSGPRFEPVSPRYKFIALPLHKFDRFQNTFVPNVKLKPKLDSD